MGKKPESVSDVSAKKVVISKVPEAAAPAAEIKGVEIKAAEIPSPQIPASAINGTEIGTTPAEEAVRIGAYFRWDAAGRPGGDGVRFWLEAEQELTAGGAAAPEQSLQKQ